VRFSTERTDKPGAFVKETEYRGGVAATNYMWGEAVYPSTSTWANKVKLLEKKAKRITMINQRKGREKGGEL